MDLEIHGEIAGLKKATSDKLKALYSLRLPPDCLWTEELLEAMASVSSETNRETALYLDRKGQITDVGIGTQQNVALHSVEGKRNLSRLSGTRCLHTHPNGSGCLSVEDLHALKQLHLDAIVAIGIRDGRIQELYVGVLSPDNPREATILGPYSARLKDFSAIWEAIIAADQKLRHKPPENETTRESAILVGLETPDSRDLNGASEAEVSLSELEQLAETAGATVTDRVIQKRNSRNSATVIGQGKIKELRMLVQSAQADLVIFDTELNGSQQRNIEEEIGCKVLSRTALILDIFAQHARSREGILQVELAQLEYRLPRLTGMGTALSRLGGGIGTRGPGETKLEVDRRLIRTRISQLKQQLAEVRKQRSVLRSKRRQSSIPLVSLVGYTNAGKSTLLNALCESDVLTENKLFATLDTTVRSLTVNVGHTVLLADTVGFIRQLPPGLLAAFKSTLEELDLSDLIIIVADASDPQVENHVHIVDGILTELGVNLKPALIVLNKIDKIEPGSLNALSQEDRPVVEISAARGDGLIPLKKAIAEALFGNRITVELFIPFTNGAALAWLHGNTRVLREAYEEKGTLLEVELDPSLLDRVSTYLTNKNPEPAGF